MRPDGYRVIYAIAVQPQGRHAGGHAMATAKVLVADDDESVRRTASAILCDSGLEVLEAPDGDRALHLLQTAEPTAALVDLRMPGMDGLEVVERGRALGFSGGFVLMSGLGRFEDAVAAMRHGVSGYVVKPLERESLLGAVAPVLELPRHRPGVQLTLPEIPGMLGSSAAMRPVFDRIRRVAPTRATVLVLGESGTGKELVAEAIHAQSPRARGPLVRVNCAALTESLVESELFGHEKGAFTGAAGRRIGRFEQAHQGTLFLDEIGELPQHVQVRLLRFLQRREVERVGGNETVPVDTRVVAATHRDLSAAVKAGTFREDLYHRLNVVEIELPALRNRREDVPVLVERFAARFGLDAFGRASPVSEAAVRLLCAYPWPGNVRELENVVERAVVLAGGGEVQPAHLPERLGGPPAERGYVEVPGARLADIERDAILRTLESVGGSTSAAARVLGISVRTIQYRLKEYGIRGDDAPI